MSIFATPISRMDSFSVGEAAPEKETADMIPINNAQPANVRIRPGRSRREGLLPKSKSTKKTVAVGQTTFANWHIAAPEDGRTPGIGQHAREEAPNDLPRMSPHLCGDQHERGQALNVTTFRRDVRNEFRNQARKTPLIRLII